jgi:hypothetical protein
MNKAALLAQIMRPTLEERRKLSDELKRGSPSFFACSIVHRLVEGQRD